MVARRILVPPVRVRILPRQHKERAKSLRFSSFFIFIPPRNVKNCNFDTNLIQLSAQAESTVHMLNWAIRSVKFLGVEFDQSEDEEIAVSDTTHL